MRIFAALVLPLLLASPSVSAGADNVVAIVVDTSNLGQRAAEEIRGGVDAQVLAGLRAANLDVVSTSDEKLVAQALSCDGALCLQELAQSADLALVVQVRIEAKKKTKKRKSDYDVSMLVVRGAPDAQAWREESTCPGCDAEETKHISYLLASMIGERVSSETPRARAVTAPPVALPPPEPPAALAPPLATETAAPPAVIQIPTPAPSPSWSVSRYVSVPLLVGGMALVGSGIYLLHINGRGTCSLTSAQEICPRRYKTEALGLGLVAGGGLVSLAGLTGLIVFSPKVGSTRVAITCGASSIVATGAF